MEKGLRGASWDDLFSYIGGLSDVEWKNLIENLPLPSKRVTLDELQTVMDKEDGYGRNK